MSRIPMTINREGRPATIVVLDPTPDDIRMAAHIVTQNWFSRIEVGRGDEGQHYLAIDRVPDFLNAPDDVYEWLERLGDTRETE